MLNKKFDREWMTIGKPTKEEVRTINIIIIVTAIVICFSLGILIWAGHANIRH